MAKRSTGKRSTPKRSTPKRSTPKRSTAKYYRCRVEVSVLSVKGESSQRFGPGKLVSAELVEALVGKGGALEGRRDCFEPADVNEGDDGTTDRT